jgi:hypothetical protein
LNEIVTMSELTTSEVLNAVRDKFPKCDYQALKLWAKAGYIGPHTRGRSLGYKQGLTESTWPADTIERIELCHTVCNQRLNQNALKALYMAGKYINGAGLKALLLWTLQQPKNRRGGSKKGRITACHDTKGDFTETAKTNEVLCEFAALLDEIRHRLSPNTKSLSDDDELPTLTKILDLYAQGGLLNVLAGDINRVTEEGLVRINEWSRFRAETVIPLMKCLYKYTKAPDNLIQYLTNAVGYSSPEECRKQPNDFEFQVYMVALSLTITTVITWGAIEPLIPALVQEVTEWAFIDGHPNQMIECAFNNDDVRTEVLELTSKLFDITPMATPSL